jgi:hypothetical protein
MWFWNGPNGSCGLIYLLLVSQIPEATPQRYPPSADRAYDIDTDLQSLLQDTTISQDKELSEALAWINKLPTETSCVQLAAMKLMTECKLLDNPSEFAKEFPEVHLDDIKLEYAVKLAACEIAGAQPDQPYHALQNCEVFLPSVQACTKRSWWGRTQQQSPSQMPCYPEASENNLHACFKTLRASPQYWTSYSNAKFRATNMCQLSRHAIEREKTIQLHKNLTLVTFRLQSSLHNVDAQMRAVQAELKEYTEDFKRSNEDMKQSTDQFRKFSQDARKDAQQDREQTKQEMRSVQVEIGLVRDSIITDITSHNAKFNAQMDTTLTKAVAAVRDGHVDTLAAIGAELQSFYQGIRNEGSELAVSMNTELQQYHDKALEALHAQHGVMMESYHILSGGLDNANYKVDELKDKVDILDNQTDRSLAKIDLLDNRLDGIGTKFQSVERAFAFMDTMLGLGKTCGLVILILLALSSVFLAGRSLKTVAWTVLALSTLGSLVYVLNRRVSLEPDPTPATDFTTHPPEPLESHLKAEFLLILAASCFLAAAFLPKINAACEDVAERVDSLAFKSACRLGILRHQRDNDDVIVLPTSEVPSFIYQDSTCPPVYSSPEKVTPSSSSSHARFDSLSDPPGDFERAHALV